MKITEVKVNSMRELCDEFKEFITDTMEDKELFYDIHDGLNHFEFMKYCLEVFINIKRED